MRMYVGYNKGSKSGFFSPFEWELKKIEPNAIHNDGDDFFYCGNGNTEPEECNKRYKEKALLVFQLVTGRNPTEKEFRMIGDIVVEASQEFSQKAGIDNMTILIRYGMG